jgi:hypothetical protein
MLFSALSLLLVTFLIPTSGYSVGKRTSLGPAERACLVTFGETHQLDAAKVEQLFGVDTEMYVCLANVPDWFKQNPEFYKLMYDPDRTLISPQTVREAMAAMEAVRQSIVRGPIVRAPRGSTADFFDGDGNPLDVKTYASKRTPKGLDFDPHILTLMIKQKLDRFSRLHPNDQNKPMRILLDTTYLTRADLMLLTLAMDEMLTSEQRSRITQITLTEPLRYLRPRN